MQVLALWSAVGKMVPGWTLTRDTILRQNVAAVVQAVPSQNSSLWTWQWQAAADSKMTGETSGAPTGVLPVSVQQQSSQPNREKLDLIAAPQHTRFVEYCHIKHPPYWLLQECVAAFLSGT